MGGRRQQGRENQNCNKRNHRNSNRKEINLKIFLNHKTDLYLMDYKK